MDRKTHELEGVWRQWPGHGTFHRGSCEVMVGSDMSHVKNLPQTGCLFYFKKGRFLFKGELPEEYASFQGGTEHL